VGWLSSMGESIRISEYQSIRISEREHQSIRRSDGQVKSKIKKQKSKMEKQTTDHRLKTEDQ